MVCNMRFPTYTKNKFYHIYNRGVSKMKICRRDEDYRYFIYLISKYKRIARIKIDEGCIMPNHLHLLVQSPRTHKNISKFMQRIQQCYSRYYNREHGHKGHVFESVYQHNELSTTSSIEYVKNYIINNPVKAKLVKKPEDWPYRIRDF